LELERGGRAGDRVDLLSVARSGVKSIAGGALGPSGYVVSTGLSERVAVEETVRKPADPSDGEVTARRSAAADGGGSVRGRTSATCSSAVPGPFASRNRSRFAEPVAVRNRSASAEPVAVLRSAFPASVGACRDPPARGLRLAPSRAQFLRLRAPEPPRPRSRSQNRRRAGSRPADREARVITSASRMNLPRQGFKAIICRVGVGGEQNLPQVASAAGVGRRCERLVLAYRRGAPSRLPGLGRT